MCWPLAFEVSSSTTFSQCKHNPIVFHQTSKLVERLTEVAVEIVKDIDSLLGEGAILKFLSELIEILYVLKDHNDISCVFECNSDVGKYVFIQLSLSNDDILDVEALTTFS